MSHFADRPFRDTKTTEEHERFVDARERFGVNVKPSSSCGGSWTVVNISSGKGFDPFSTDRKRLQLKYIDSTQKDSLKDKRSFRGGTRDLLKKQQARVRRRALSKRGGRPEKQRRTIDRK